jgi:formylglycine-generating enzyme required for sulfatase activity
MKNFVNNTYFLLLISFFLGLGLLATHAQESESLDNAGYGFDSVNGRNRDWQVVSKLSDSGIEMVLVPAGSFMMGSSPQEIEDVYQECLAFNLACERRSYELEGPEHLQEFPEPFWIDRFEISREQYNQCLAAGICTATELSEISTEDSQPINLVTWQQARNFCESWRGARLPTEAEWEYVARGPSGWIYPWGNDFDSSRLNFCDQHCEAEDHTADNDGYQYPAAINEYPEGASWVGAYNMTGNVWEWTSTRLRSYPYEADSRHESLEANDVRVIRGGSYNTNTTYIRSQTRFWLDQTTAGRGVGFRCLEPILPEN